MTHQPADDPTRRTFVLGTVVAMSTPALAACDAGSTTDAGASPRHVDYVVIGDQDWMSRAMADLAGFAATEPGFTVATRLLTGTQHDDGASRLIFSADPPALIRYDISRARFADIIAAGAAADLTDFWARMLPDVGPAVTDWYTTNGRRYAVPLGILLYPVICYDVALFRRLGITPPPTRTRSWSQAEFLDACATMRVAGLDPLAIGGLDLSTQLAEAFAATALSQEELQRYSVEAWQPGSRYSYTDDAWTHVFGQMQKWVESNVFQPRPAGADQVSAQRSFIGGVSGMVGGGSWTVASLRRLASAAGRDLELDWMLFPTIRHPSRLLAFPGKGAFIPAAGTQHEQAEQLLGFMLRQDRMLAAARAYGHIPPFDVPGLKGALDALVASMLEFGSRQSAPCLNWPTELEAPFARVSRAVLAGTATPLQAGRDMEDGAGLARTASR